MAGMLRGHDVVVRPGGNRSCSRKRFGPLLGEKWDDRKICVIPQQWIMTSSSMGKHDGLRKRNKYFLSSIRDELNICFSLSPMPEMVGVVM